MTDRALLGAVNFANSPKAVCKLLRAIAGGTDAIKNRHDTILIAAAEMIEAYDRRTRGDPDEADGIVRMGDMG